MIQFQGGKYCDIKIRHHPEKSYIGDYLVRIRDTGDTHLDIACNDLSHALRLWTDIERSPEVKIVVNVNDYIVKDQCEDCALYQLTYGTKSVEEIHGKENAETDRLYREAYPNKESIARSHHELCPHSTCTCPTCESVRRAEEFADCRHRPIKDSKPGEFDLERME